MQKSDELVNPVTTPRMVLLEPNELARQALGDLLDSVTTLEVIPTGSIAEATEAIIEQEPEFLMLRSRWNRAEVQQLLSARPGLQLVVILSGKSRDELGSGSSQPAAGFHLEDRISTDGFQFQEGDSTREDAAARRSREVLLDQPKPRLKRNRHDLTPRENDVLRELVAGLTNREIGAALGMSDSSVKRHIGVILAKLNSPNRTSAAIKAMRDGLIKDKAR